MSLSQEKRYGILLCRAPELHAVGFLSPLPPSVRVLHHQKNPEGDLPWCSIRCAHVVDRLFIHDITPQSLCKLTEKFLHFRRSHRGDEMWNDRQPAKA